MRVTASTLCLLATLSSSFPKGISARKKDTCKSFSGANAASDARDWCNTLDNKCCTDAVGSTGVVSSDACDK